MNNFAVWAPFAQDLTLVLNSDRYTMEESDNGWWALHSPEPKEGDRYGYIINGEGPYPDPRSRSQPDGIHGLSEVRILENREENEHLEGNTRWQTPEIENALIYELHVGTFTEKGTFLAVAEHLDYLIELGVTHVEIMPVAEFSGEWGWGYDGVQLYATHHAYGSPDDLKSLISQCHAKGLAVILDVVYNHLGPTGNYLGKYGPYFTDRYHTPWGDAVNLDGEYSDQVRRFFIDNALMWLQDFHFDGLRLDAVHAIFDNSAIHFLRQLASEVEDLQTQLKRPLILIAESDLNDPKIINAPEIGGYGLHAQWSDDFHHALHALLTKEQAGYYADFGSISHLAKALKQGFVYDGIYSNFRKRVHGDSPKNLNSHQLLGYLQTHDQIGNRAKGERSSHLLSNEQLKLGAAIVILSPFTPMLFQGEEWAASTPFLYFSHHKEPELAKAVSLGRQNEFSAFGWQPEDIPDPQLEQTFYSSKLNWDELQKPAHKELLEWHKALIQLRKRTSEAAKTKNSDTQVMFDEKQKWLWFTRGGLIVFANLSDGVCTLERGELKQKELLLSSDKKIECHNNQLTISAYGVAVLEAVDY